MAAKEGGGLATIFKPRPRFPDDAACIISELPLFPPCSLST